MELVKNARLKIFAENTKYRWIGWLVVASLIVIALLPLITESSVYNHITGYDQPRSDFRDYTTEIQSWIDGEPVEVNGYLARVIIGYPIMLLNQVSGVSLDRIYIVFCFLSLIAAGIMVYWMVKELTDKQSAWLAVILAFMCSTGVLAMFYFGMISNIINMYIILPVCIYAAVKWQETGKVKYIVISAIAMGVFSLFHTTSLYIPYVIMVITVLLSVAVLMKKKVGFHKASILLLILLVINVGISFTLLPSAVQLNEIAFSNAEAITTGGTTTQIYHSAMPIGQFIVEYLTIPVGLMALVIFGLWKKQVDIDKKTKYLLLILASLIITFSIGAFLGLSPEPVRTSTDLATVMAILIAAMIGVTFKNNQSVYLRVPCYILMAYGVTSNLIHWIR